MSRLVRGFTLGVTIARLADEHDVKYPAAALAYYAFVSQVPLLVLVFAALSDRLVSQVQAATPALLTPDAQRLMAEALSTASGRVGAAVLAVAVLAWSWANIVTGFQTVVERVETGARQSLFAQLRAAGSIFGSFGLVVVSIVLTNGVFALVPMSRMMAYGEPIIQFVTLTSALLPL
jgi:membrane protein